MALEDSARAEAVERYDGDWIIDERTGEQVSHDDYGYSETARQAFVQGASWLSEYLLSDEGVERAARSLTGLSDELWVVAKEDGTAHLAYYFDAARAALSAVLGTNQPNKE